ncbi:TPA: MerR family DNA-binding transcriptional regulator, partial [Streptococcus suis]
MKSFLTIGQLSKLSNIHIKALRYYESINILEPTYIDPNNSYRYYSHANVLYVKTIKICADYGIPLKTFHHFINEK